MTKRKKHLTIVSLIVLSVFLCACGEKKNAGIEDSTENLTEITTETVEVPKEVRKPGVKVQYDGFEIGEHCSIFVSDEGTVFLLKTNWEKEYVNFLESLDMEKYQIIDITPQPQGYRTSQQFVVTFTKK